MSKARKPVNKKKIIKGILIFLAVFIVLNLLGAGIGTAVSITHPKRYTYEGELEQLEDDGCLGDFNDYDKQEYIVKGLDGYELHCMKVSTEETEGTGLYVIISHGYHSTMYSGAKYCGAYIELGFTCIIYDLRAHGANEKAICSMGGYEGQDLNYIIEDTFARYGDVDILSLHGESMGTSASLNSLRYTDKVDSTLPKSAESTPLRTRACRSCLFTEPMMTGSMSKTVKTCMPKQRNTLTASSGS